MDRSYLSRPEVIEASKKFVCVRMMTYESESEARVLQSFWRPGAPLENTVFIILDPQGRPLIRGDRGPRRMFRDSRELADTMNRISRSYKGNGEPKELPAVPTVRLALNVAACDKRPLLIVVARDSARRKALADRLATLVWRDELAGKLIYATAAPGELDQIEGVNRDSTYLFVLPDQFGVKGKVGSQLPLTATARDIVQATDHCLAVYQPQYVPTPQQVMAGERLGIHWQTKLPVTDPHALQAQAKHRH